MFPFLVGNGGNISLNWDSKLVFPIIKSDFKCSSVSADL